MKLTKEEKDLIEENRRKEQDKKEEAEYWENYGEYQAQLKQGKKEISLEDFELIAMDLF